MTTAEREFPPLWRFALHILFVAFAAQRGVAALVLQREQAPRTLVVIFALQAIASGLAAIGMLAGRWLVASVAAVGATVVAGAVARAFMGGGVALAIAMSEALVAIASAGMLAYLLHREGRG